MTTPKSSQIKFFADVLYHFFCAKLASKLSVLPNFISVFSLKWIKLEMGNEVVHFKCNYFYHFKNK